MLTFVVELVIMSVRQDTQFYKKFSFPVFSLGVNSICFLLSLIFIILIIKRLMYKGTSPHLRKIIFFRYLLLYILFFGQYINMIMKNYGELLNMHKLHPESLLMIEFYSMFFIPLIRMSEPLIMQTLLETFR